MATTHSVIPEARPERGGLVIGVAAIGRAAGLMVLGVALLSAACGGDGDTDASPASDDRSVESSDGALVLSIPAGALPDGVAASEISVTTLALTEAPARGAPADRAAGPIASFRLEPSGLRFSTPVELAVTVPLAALSGPLFAELVSDDGTTEVLEVEISEPVGDDQLVVLTTSIEHFSTFTVGDLNLRLVDLLAVKLEAPASVPVGSSFDVALTVIRPGESAVAMGNSSGDPFRNPPRPAFGDVPYIVIFEDTSWSVSGAFFPLAGSPVSPPSVPAEGRPRTEISGLSFETSGTFRCDAIGEWKISYTGTVAASYSGGPIDPAAGGNVRLPVIFPGQHWSQLSPVASGECVASTAVSTEEPRTSGDRPPEVTPLPATVILPTTTYKIEVSDPDGDDSALFIAWSGQNCGEAHGTTTTTMAWTHDGGRCDHSLEHQDVTITVLVSDGIWEVRCRYQGAAAKAKGTCDEPVLSP